MADAVQNNKTGSAPKKQPGRGGKLPSKQSINLVVREDHTQQNIVALILFACFMVFLVFFSRYFVADKLAEADRLEQQYYERLQTLESLKAQSADLDETRAEYSHYGNGYLNEDELALQDRMQMLDVIERRLLSIGALESMSIEDNVATLTVNSAKLSNVSELVAEIEEEKIVSYVTVSTAQTNDKETTQQVQNPDGTTVTETVRTGQDVISTMTIYFLTPAEVGTLSEDEAPDADASGGATDTDAAADTNTTGEGDNG